MIYHTAQIAEQMRGMVKPLQWEYREQAMLTYVVRRHWGIEYYINQTFGSDSYYFTTIKHDGTVLYDGDDLPSAQSAAQADYEQYILSTISPDIAKIVEERDRLREALRPFAWLANVLDTCGYEDAEWVDDNDAPLQAGDYRRARAALSHNEQGGEK